MSKKVILTGLRTNAEYHLGNYLGALMPMVKMAHSKAGEYQVNLFAPDLHSFTTPIDFTTFHEQTLQNLKLFVACGFPLDKEDVYLYRQSRIPANSELTWILSCFTGFGEMARMVEFKDKSEKLGDDRVTVGLFSYPMLMACDILLYNASYVPLGEDQRQHLEFTREIAKRINNRFGELFVVPEAQDKQQSILSRETAPRIRSLRDPSKKMSKSVDDPAGTIKLSDSPKEATKKIMGATTDNIGIINFDWNLQPGITNLLQILSILQEVPQSEINKLWTGKTSYGDLKTAVSEAVAKTLDTIQSSLKNVSETELMKKIEESEAKMNEVANQTLRKVQKAIGLY